MPDIPGGRIVDVAIAADDLDGDGLAEIVVAALFDTGRGVDVRMIVGSDAQSAGGPSWSSATTIQFPEVVFAQCRGLDLAFFRTGSTPSPGAVITIVTEDAGGSTAWTWRKPTFSSRNMHLDWQRTAPTFALPPNAVSVAIASWDLGRRTGVTIGGSDVSLANLLSNLRTAWRAAIPRVPNYAATAPGGAADPDDNLLKSLALTPLGEYLAVRPSAGPAYVEDALPPVSDAAARQFSRRVDVRDLEGVLRSLGPGRAAADAPPDERVRWTSVRFTPEHIDIGEPWVQDGADPWRAAGGAVAGGLNYLQWLATAPPTEIHDQNLPGRHRPERAVPPAATRAAAGVLGRRAAARVRLGVSAAARRAKPRSSIRR